MNAVDRSRRAPRILGLGGTMRAGSMTERVLQRCLIAAERQGAKVDLIGGAGLVLPFYSVEAADRTPEGRRLIDAFANCDGVVLASPAYHGSISGLLKNALDYTEDLKADGYLDGKAVGCIACAAGWQAAGTTLATLRAIVHALRGWPTPLGVALNTSGGIFSADGKCCDATVANQLETLGEQVVEFSRMRTLFQRDFSER